MSDTERAFYRREGELLVPTGLGVSHWDPSKQGGAPVAGLAAQLLDGVATQNRMVPARLTIDILGAVPMAPLSARLRVLRDGIRVQLSEIELVQEDRIRVRASMLRLRESSDAQDGEALAHPFPEGAEGQRRVVAESIRIEGSESTAGSGAVWMRVITPVIAGEPLNMLAGIAMAADWGTSVAPPADPRAWTYANLDITVHLTRMPRSDWMLLDGTSETPGNGIAMTTLRIGDRRGLFATAHQSVFLEPIARG